ncbi:hypothetical protein L0156_15920 [bacterium]|nr:hypothetical protein [bacterium]
MKQETLLLTEKEVIGKLREQPELYSPLEIKVKRQQKSASPTMPDAEIDLSWKGRNVLFQAEIKSRTAPKGVYQAASQLKAYLNQKENGLLIVPFLSQAIVDILNREDLSGIDLNGNYLIQTKDLLAIRLDRRNRFKESQLIKNIFSGNSSMVGRLFLVGRKQFNSVNEIYSSIKQLGGRLSLSAISKVLKVMENELIIERNKKRITLVQSDKLLRNLQDKYRPPRISNILKIKLSSPARGLKEINNLIPKSSRWIFTGKSSAERYAVTTPAKSYEIYVTNTGSLIRYEDERFFNTVVYETDDSFPYFDVRESERLPWSSPLQSYLELSQLDKREKELAASIRDQVLGISSNRQEQ